jgi:hypothetical protein
MCSIVDAPSPGCAALRPHIGMYVDRTGHEFRRASRQCGRSVLRGSLGRRPRQVDDPCPEHLCAT